MSQRPPSDAGHPEVILVAPPVFRGRAYPCVGLGYIGGVLRARGHRVRIVDTNFTGEEPGPVLREAPPCLVGIGCEARNVEPALALAALAKQHGHTTVLGGLHVSLTTSEVLEHPQVDLAVQGEGEIAMPRLVEALGSGTGLESVPGLIYRPRGHAPGPCAEPCINPPENPDDLDDLPWPAYDLAGIREIVEYPLITSRACPYRCSFCSVGNLSARWRAREPHALIDELLHARRTYDIRRFCVMDEMFSLDIGRVETFCRLLIKKRSNLPWSVMEGLRADAVSTELLRLLKRAGCSWVIFGIETVDEDVFKGISKGEALSQVHEAIIRVKREGLRVGGYFVIGLPGATLASDMRAIRYASSMGLDYAAFWMANPYRGTALYDWVGRHATLLREPVGDSVVNSLSTQPLFECPSYPAAQVKRAHAIANLRQGYRTFYDAPPPVGALARARHRARVLGMVLRYDPSHLLHYLAGIHTRPSPAGWRGWLARRWGRPLAGPVPGWRSSSSGADRA